MDKRQAETEVAGDARPDVEEAHQAALLIDFDNVTMGIRSNLGQELRSLLNSDVIRGKVAVQRAYADWRRYPQYIVPLSEASIDLIFAPAYGSSKKNATDIRLAIDALELVFIRPEIRTFILMSGDSDFSSLVLKLKEYGKYVIGVGIQESSSDLLVQNCDEYYSYSALSGLSKSGDQPLVSHDPWMLAEKAVNKMLERGDTMRSDRLKQVMLEIDPTFNEREQGFSKFNRFVVEAASRGLVSIQKMENGQYGVAPATAKGPGAKEETGGGKKRETKGRRGGEKRERERTGGQERGRAREEDGTRRARAKLTMKAALALLGRALDSLVETDTDSVRDSDVKRKLLELDPHFDEGELGYSKFSKFLQAAEEQGAVALSRGPNGNYHVSRRKSKRAGKSKKVEPEKKQDEGASAGTMQRLARFLFGARPEEPVAAAKPAGAPRTKAEPEPKRREGPRRRSTAAPGGKKGERPQRSAAERAEASESRKAPRGGGRAPRSEAAAERSGRGRRREPRAGARSQRGGTRASSEGSVKAQAEGAVPTSGREVLPEKAAVERPAEEVTPKAVEQTGDEPGVDAGIGASTGVEPERERPGGRATSAVTPAPLPGAPRGTIRGRWGTRGRYRPSEERPPIFEGQKPQRSAERSSRPEGPREAEGEAKAGAGANDVLSRLKSYTGVGDRTARTLVEAFGMDLFRVLDEEPDRVREVLPDHRADRVLEARRREVERRRE